jgi:hypothetical protein
VGKSGYASHHCHSDVDVACSASVLSSFSFSATFASSHHQLLPYFFDQNGCHCREPCGAFNPPFLPADAEAKIRGFLTGRLCSLVMARWAVFMLCLEWTRRAYISDCSDLSQKGRRRLVDCLFDVAP